MTPDIMNSKSHQIAVGYAKLRGIANTLNQYCDFGLDGHKSIDRLKAYCDELMKEAETILALETNSTKKTSD